MQENTPITGSYLNPDDVLGGNIKLLILNKAFNEIVDGEDLRKEEEAKE